MLTDFLLDFTASSDSERIHGGTGLPAASILSDTSKRPSPVKEGSRKQTILPNASYTKSCFFCFGGGKSDTVNGSLGSNYVKQRSFPSLIKCTRLHWQKNLNEISHLGEIMTRYQGFVFSLLWICKQPQQMEWLVIPWAEFGSWDNI